MNTKKIKIWINDNLINTMIVCSILSIFFMLGFFACEKVNAAKVTDSTAPIISEGEAGQKTLDGFESKVRESENQQPKHYELTEAERTLIEQVVAAESRGEPYDGQVAVAQCILNACLKDDITPAQAIKKYGYTSNRVKATDSVKEAVSAVFDRGEGVTDEPITFFYAHNIATSDWHESQTFVIEIANHRFFKEA